MTSYPKSKTLSKEGVNYVRGVVDKAASIFKEVHDENDIGIDAHIEFLKNEYPTNRIIGLQIKSGESYYNKRKNECIIPVGKHYDYWLNYPLPVYGIVYVPSLRHAYWINIKKYLKHEYERSGVVKRRIKYKANTSYLLISILINVDL